MQLKPCPFCGGDTTTHRNGAAVFIGCDYCGAQANTHVGHNAKRDAARAWNTRHNEVPVVDEVPPLDNQRRESDLNPFNSIYSQMNTVEWKMAYYGTYTTINPCANCGSSETKLNDNPRFSIVYISCTHCDRIGERCSTPDMAITEWNNANPINAN